MSKPPTPRIAVLGAGPVGLEAAVYATALGLDVHLFDRGDVAEHLKAWGFVRMFTPAGLNVSPLGAAALKQDGRPVPAETDVLTGRAFRDAYLVPLAESTALRGRVHTRTEIVAVGRAVDGSKVQTFRVLVRDETGAERIEPFDAVLDCTGTFARPNGVGPGGIPAVGEAAAAGHLAYGVTDVLGEYRGQYAGKSVIVIGGGYSAATVVADLATLAETEQATWVIWLTRGPRGSQPIARIPGDPLKDRDRLAVRANTLASRGDGNLEFHTQTHVDEVICHGPDQGFRVAGRVAGKPMSWDVERVIAAVGYRADRALGENVRADEPGYHVLGAKAGGPGFLLTDAHDQIRRAFAAITGKPRLDAYAGKAA